MSEQPQITIGRVAFERTEPRVVRVVKAKDRPDVLLRRHSLGLLRSLVVMFPKETQEILDENNTCQTTT